MADEGFTLFPLQGNTLIAPFLPGTFSLTAKYFISFCFNNRVKNCSPHIVSQSKWNQRNHECATMSGLLSDLWMKHSPFSLDYISYLPRYVEINNCQTTLEVVMFAFLFAHKEEGFLA